LGAGGEIKLRGQGAVEQGFRLSIEGWSFAASGSIWKPTTHATQLGYDWL